MFSGIIESLGSVEKIEHQGSNINIWVSAAFTHELKVDQSVAHNGVCLTVVEISDNVYKVTAIKETLEKTNLQFLKNGDVVNLERCLQLNARIDGHMVQGHVDQTAECINKIEENGSWLFTFAYDDTKGNLTVEKGSVCVNGVSLTVVNSGIGEFSVAIIPYTFEHTSFKNTGKGTIVNLEFDVIGKYVQAYMNRMKK
jgi:riboflavin synthase